MPFAYYDRLGERDKAIYRASDRVTELRLPRPEELRPLVDPIRAALAALDSRLGGGLVKLVLEVALKAAGPAPRVYNPGTAPVMKLIRELAARRDVAHVCVQKPGFRLEMRGRTAHAAA